ncbi:MAG: hypothetical protein HY856_15265 [Burkholderiales bacterium]|nr:hypothetical protein [Burkholderiales bacterium]
MIRTDTGALGARCRPDTWARLQPRLAAMHWLGAAPQDLVDLLQDVPGPLRPEAQRVLGAMARGAWQVRGLSGPYRQAARLGFVVQAGRLAWWLRFELAPQLRVVSIEPVAVSGG